jgi:hypothetical protein
MREARMMTEMNTKQRYRLRLTERYVDYAPDRGVHVWREWAADQVVSDIDDIKLLEAAGAPVERVALITTEARGGSDDRVR